MYNEIHTTQIFIWTLTTQIPVQLSLTETF